MVVKCTLCIYINTEFIIHVRSLLIHASGIYSLVHHFRRLLDLYSKHAKVLKHSHKDQRRKRLLKALFKTIKHQQKGCLQLQGNRGQSELEVEIHPPLLASTERPRHNFFQMNSVKHFNFKFFKIFMKS